VAKRVLLSVEDSDSEYCLIGLALKEIDIAVELCRAVDGEQAIWFLEKSHGYELAPRPDLILLDLNLPKQGGFEVLAEIQGRETFRSIPVIVFTTSSSASSRKRALAIGAARYISKPGTLTDFFETLRAVCSQYLIDR
jgi:CheY-like chemotaxis protein